MLLYADPQIPKEFSCQVSFQILCSRIGEDIWRSCVWQWVFSLSSRTPPPLTSRCACWIMPSTLFSVPSDVPMVGPASPWRGSRCHSVGGSTLMLIFPFYTYVRSRVTNHAVDLGRPDEDSPRVGFLELLLKLHCLQLWKELLQHLNSGTFTSSCRADSVYAQKPAQLFVPVLVM